MPDVIFADPFGSFVDGFQQGSRTRLEQEETVFKTIVAPALQARERALARQISQAAARRRAARQSASAATALSAQIDQQRLDASAPTGTDPTTGLSFGQPASTPLEQNIDPASGFSLGFPVDQLATDATPQSAGAADLLGGVAVPPPAAASSAPAAPAAPATVLSELPPNERGPLPPPASAGGFNLPVTSAAPPNFLARGFGRLANQATDFGQELAERIVDNAADFAVNGGAAGIPVVIGPAPQTAAQAPAVRPTANAPFVGAGGGTGGLSNVGGSTGGFAAAIGADPIPFVRTPPPDEPFVRQLTAPGTPGLSSQQQALNSVINGLVARGVISSRDAQLYHAGDTAALLRVARILNGRN